MMNQKEAKQLAKLLSKVDKPQDGLPQPIFDALYKIIPLVACEMIIKNKKGILLTWRDDKWFHGWHVPGGILRYQEDFNTRIAKVAQHELGVKVTKREFLFYINYVRGTRGQCVSLVFLCETDREPQDGKFFKEMPKDILPEHRALWKKAKKALRENKKS